MTRTPWFGRYSEHYSVSNVCIAYRRYYGRIVSFEESRSYIWSCLVGIWSSLFLFLGSLAKPIRLMPILFLIAPRNRRRHRLITLLRVVPFV